MGVFMLEHEDYMMLALELAREAGRLVKLLWAVLLLIRAEL